MARSSCVSIVGFVFVELAGKVGVDIDLQFLAVVRTKDGAFVPCGFEVAAEPTDGFAVLPFWAGGEPCALMYDVRDVATGSAF